MNLYFDFDFIFLSFVSFVTVPRGKPFFWFRVCVPRKREAKKEGDGERKFHISCLSEYVSWFVGSEVLLGVTVQCLLAYEPGWRGKAGLRTLWNFRIKRWWFGQEYSGENILKDVKARLAGYFLWRLPHQNRVKGGT